jgi:hypothetical protein
MFGGQPILIVAGGPSLWRLSELWFDAMGPSPPRGNPATRKPGDLCPFAAALRQVFSVKGAGEFTDLLRRMDETTVSAVLSPRQSKA